MSPTPTPTPPPFGEFFVLTASGQPHYFLFLRTWEMGDLFIAALALVIAGLIVLTWAFEFSRGLRAK
jgi:hypothetical protein